MRTFLLASSTLLGLACATAHAADMAARPYPKALAPEPVSSWSGFYIGGNAGYSWGRSNSDVSYFNSVTGAPIVPHQAMADGFQLELVSYLARNHGLTFVRNLGKNGWLAGSSVHET